MLFNIYLVAVTPSIQCTVHWRIWNLYRYLKATSKHPHPRCTRFNMMTIQLHHLSVSVQYMINLIKCLLLTWSSSKLSKNWSSSISFSVFTSSTTHLHWWCSSTEGGPFCYLRSTKFVDDETLHRITLGSVSSGRLKERIFQIKNFRAGTKVSVHRVAWVLNLLYRPECWIQYQHQIRQIEASHARSLHSILGLT